MKIITLEKPLPLCIHIHESCTVKENSNQIIIAEPDGKEHIFPKGSYVFTKRDNTSVWD